MSHTVVKKGDGFGTNNPTTGANADAVTAKLFEYGGDNYMVSRTYDPINITQQEISLYKFVTGSWVKQVDFGNSTGVLPDIYTNRELQ